MAELPAALLLLLIGIAFPCIIFSSIFYRVYMFNCMVKNSCQVGASQVDVPTGIQSVKDFLVAKSLSGVVVNPAPTVTVLKRAITYTPSSGPKVTYTAYFLQVVATGTVDPIVHFTSFFGLSIPGLTGPVPLSCTQATYFENQQSALSFAGP